jgi:hypothetical protein
MAAAQSFVNLTPAAQSGIITFLRHARARYQYFYSIRTMMEAIDRDYYREYAWSQENLRARLANRVGDTTKFQDVTIPVVMPQVEAFVTYQSSVFLTGTPIFGVVADPAYEDAALALEAVLSNQAAKTHWKSELIKFFRDGGKYALSAMEVSWDKITTPTFETDVSDNEGNGSKVKQVIWSGNRLKRWDLYNSFWDTNCHPHEVAEYGEYAGNNQLMTRTRLKKLIASLGDDVIIGNVKAAFESPTPLNEYYIPQINPQALVSLTTLVAGQEDWFSWVGKDFGSNNIAYKYTYIVTTLYIRMLPSDFNIKAPQPNTPQVWKFIVINMNVIIYAERMTNAHDMIPVLFACPNDDGLKYQTKSMANNVQPLQSTATAVSNAMVAALRRSISDRGIYNPLYIESKHINSENPAAKIPCKPTAYAGVGLNEMYMPIPFNNDQFPVYSQTVNQLMGFADIVSGQNKAQQGQFVKGNKTLHEYDDIMGNANGRSQLTSIAYEDDFFTPLKEILKINILQYQGQDELFHSAAKKNIKVDPLVLRNAVYEFKISDGQTPSDKIINADAWTVAMQSISTSPQIGQGYNLAPMFSYLMKTQGADVSEFEKPAEQLQYEQAVSQWQQVVMQALKENPDIKQEQLPPQPLPEQFGIGQDGKPTKQQQAKPSIIEQFMMANEEAAESGAGHNAQEESAES